MNVFKNRRAMLKVSKRWIRATQGALLGFGAPLGWLAISFLLSTFSLSPGEHAIYTYMLFGTCIAFSVFGYLCGCDEEQLELILRIDQLTGAFNRRFFWEQLEMSCSQAAVSGRRVGLLLLDIDNFKAINDTLGHPVGDAVLAATSRAMGRILRQNEYLCRIGGDEFAVIVEGERDSANEVAHRIQNALAKARKKFDPTRVCPTRACPTRACPVRGMSPAEVSCGVAASAALSAQKLYERADEALYQAKRSGKGSISDSGLLRRREGDRA